MKVDAEEDRFRVGDVITVQGPSVPRELWERQFRVQSVGPDGMPTLTLIPTGNTAERAQAARLKARA